MTDKKRIVFMISVPVIVAIFSVLVGLNAQARTQATKELNPLFNPIDPYTGEFSPVDKKAVKVYTQQQSDMSMLYGKLDVIEKKIEQLQNTCAIR